jgi:hypothetical protein
MTYHQKPISLEERLNKLEPLVPLVLSLHGTILLLIQGGPPWQWAAILVTGLLGLWGLSGWRNFNQAILLRAVVVSLVTWLLLFTTGGVGSFFLLWYFVLVSVYPFLLPPVPATLLLLGIPLSYVLLLPLSSQSIPLFVVISRVFLLAFIGGLLRVLGATMHRYVAEQQQIQRICVINQSW